MLTKIVVWIVLLNFAENSTASDGVPCKSNDFKCLQAERLAKSWYNTFFGGGLFSLSSLLLMAVAVGLGVYVSKLVRSQSTLPWKLYQYQSRIFLINQKNGEVISDVDDVEKLKTQLAEMEKERDEFKAELEKLRAADEIDSVTGQKWDDMDMKLPLRLDSQPANSAETKSAIIVNRRKFEVSNADYSRKCRYLTKKLKDTEILVRTMKNQVEMAKEIKTEFNELKEQRTEMGRQVVALTREKREAKQKVLTLQTDMRTWRKQMDCVVTRNTDLLKQVEQLNVNTKNASKEKRNLKKLAETAAEELDHVRAKLDSIHKEKEELMKKIDLLEMNRLTSLDDGISTNVLGRQNMDVQVYSAQVHHRRMPVETDGKHFAVKIGATIQTKRDRNETDAEESKNVGLNIIRDLKNDMTEENKSIAIKELERSLMKLERSVEENMRLRNSTMSLDSADLSARRHRIENYQSDDESLPCLYEGLHLSTINVPSEISCINTSIASNETLCDARKMSNGSTVSDVGYHDSKCYMNSSDDSLSDAEAKKEPEHEISVCCMDSQCSVCSVPGCTLLHISCSDVTCLTTVSSDEMRGQGEETDAEESQQLVGRESSGGDGATGESDPEPPRRLAGIERLSDIFGNGPTGEGGPWNIPGLSTIMLNSGVRPTGSVAVNAGSLARSSVGDSLSVALDGSSSDGSVSSRGSANLTPATAPMRAVQRYHHYNKKLSHFTKNAIVSNSPAFRQFLNEMAVVTDDPDMGDEGAIEGIYIKQM